MVDFADDYTGLWSVIRSVKVVFPTDDEDSTRRRTLRILGNLMERGLIQAGCLLQDGTFAPWGYSIADTLRRIHSEWLALKCTPNIGDIVWFTSTPQGDAYFSTAVAP